MKKHTKIYMEYFNYAPTEFIPCEICGCQAVDIHHIESRGMGGSNEKDFIENLMGVCRNCHNEYGDIEAIKNKLKQVHLKFMEIYGTVNKS